MQLQIEAISICQARCVFCPYPQMKRQRGTMSRALFHKIIDEAATLKEIDQVCITGLGEPLLDQHLTERVAYVRSKMPTVEITVFTNGNLLDDEWAHALKDAGVNTLYVSLNASNAAKRAAIMKLNDYAEVVAAIKRAIAIGGNKMRVVVKGIVSKDLMEDGEQEAFLQEWGDWQHGGNGLLHLEGNWAGEVWPVRVKPTTPCSRALSQIMVLWDGRVSLCCFDGEGEVIFGDLNKQSIKDVFNGPEALAYRTAHWEGRRGEMKLCDNCTAI